MKIYKKILLLIMLLGLSICMLSACEQSASADTVGEEDSGYTIDNIREQVVGIDEKMELESGKKWL